MNAQRRAVLWRMLMVACYAVLSTGCGERASAPAATHLVIKHSKLFGDPVAFRELLDRFEAEHPGLVVTSETLPASSDEQHQFYAINLRARSTAFDVLAVDVIWVAEFARAGWIADLSADLPVAERADFFSGPMAAVTYDDRVYAIPWYVDAGLLYYRRDLLDRYGREPPRTWGELVATARAISAEEPGMHGFIWQGRQYEGLVCNALEYLWSAGGTVIDAEGQLVLDSPANRAALGFMHDLVQRYGVTPPSVATATEEPSRHLFGQGRAVFLRNWPYAWRLFEREGSSLEGRVGVTQLPHFPGQTSAAALGGWQLAVNARSEHDAAARALVRFLTSSAALRHLALAYGFQPARRSLYADPELIAAQPQLTALEEIFATARPRPVHPDYVRMSQ
ncbi:MAG TPA: ABC transporter substrate-binding protein, partial [Steroidobacteraceae bacterium]|nr:ABC transporter substrate-binding protein [Steroidobacteraceae bacterium]